MHRAGIDFLRLLFDQRHSTLRAFAFLVRFDLRMHRAGIERARLRGDWRADRIGDVLLLRGHPHSPPEAWAEVLAQSVPLPCDIIIGPTIETIWFIMWCGRWQCSIQSPIYFASNSTSRACATPTMTVFPGYQADSGMRPPSVPVT